MFKSFTGRRRCLLWITIVGGVLTICSLVLALVIIPIVIHVIISNNLVIKNGTEAWDRFVKLPIPVKVHIYFFEVTNQIKVLTGEEKPNLKEIGPIVYNHYREKFDIKFEGEEYVSYYQKQIYQFDKEQSVIAEDAQISTMNFIVIGLYQIIENCRVPIPFSLEEVLPKVIDDTQLFSKYTVNAFLFNGIKFCDPQKGDTIAKLICLLIMLLNLKMILVFEDLSMQYSLFGFKNNTHDGRFVINTGVNDIKKLGLVNTYNGQMFTNVWKGEHSECNKVQGLDIATFPPYKEAGKHFQIYSSDLCRSVTLNYQGSEEFRGLDVFKYALGIDMLRPFVGESVHSTCFCSNFTRDMNGEKSCFMDGIQDLYPCMGIPGLVSQPHFLYADVKYQESVTNLTAAIEDLHESRILIHPFTGVPVKGSIGFQMNLIARPIILNGKYAPETEKLKNFTLPVLWMTELVEIPDEYFNTILEATIILKITDIGKWILVGFSGLMLVVPPLFINKRLPK